MTYTPPPRALLGFGYLITTTRKTRGPGGVLRKRWVDPDGNIYEWDGQDAALEMYDRLGRHLGEFDPETGKQLKPANPQRRVEP